MRFSLLISYIILLAMEILGLAFAGIVLMVDLKPALPKDLTLDLKRNYRLVNKLEGREVGKDRTFLPGKSDLIYAMFFGFNLTMETWPLNYCILFQIHLSRFLLKS